MTHIYKHPACIPIYCNHLPVLNAAHRAMDIENGRDAVFPGDYRAVRKLAADFQHQAAHQRENRCPAGIGCLRDQYFTGM